MSVCAGRHVHDAAFARGSELLGQQAEAFVHCRAVGGCEHVGSGGQLPHGRHVLFVPQVEVGVVLAGVDAEVLGEGVGARVGYQVRFERRISKDTRIEVLTEGLLARRLQSDPELPGVGEQGVRDPHSGIMHRALLGLLGMPIGELWNLDPLAAACAADRRWSPTTTRVIPGCLFGA